MGRKSKQRMQQPKPPKRRKERVLVGILAFEGSVNISLAHMLFQLPYLSNDPNVPWEFQFQPAECTRPQELARNKLCGAALAGGYDTLLMIDDDMIFRGAETLQLLNTPDYDIAAPLMFMFRKLPNMPAVEQCVPCAGYDDPEASTPEKPMIQPAWPVKAVPAPMDWVGSGCMAVKRSVLEDERMLLAPGYDPPAFFRNVYAPNGERVSGLDTDFCRRARKLGHRVVVNWGAQIGHYKRTDLNAVDLYAKLSFQKGYELGEKHAVQVAGQKSGQGARDDRGSGGNGQSGPEMVGVGLDRAGDAREAGEAHQARRD